MTGNIDWSVSEQSPQSLNLGINGSLDEVEARVEAVVNFAVSASRVIDHVGLEIKDPILDIAGSSEGEHNGIQGGRVSSEALNVTA